MGTPHEGLTTLSKIYGWKYNSLNDMEPDSDFIKNLNNDNYEKTQRHKYFLINGRINAWLKCKDIVHTFCYWSVSCSWHGCNKIRVCKTVKCPCCKKYWVWSGNYDYTIEESFFQFMYTSNWKIHFIPNDGIVSVDSARFHNDNHVERAPENKFYWTDHNSLPNNDHIIQYVLDKINNW